MMSNQYIEKCVRCSGEIIEKEVTEILNDGMNTVLLRIQAGVCIHCGERYFVPDTIRQIEEIEAKLKRQQTSEFEQVGKTYLAEISS